jgi:hypothetical protein
MHATMRKAAAGTIHTREVPRLNSPLDDCSREMRARLATPDRSAKMSSAEIAAEETTRTQPRSVTDIRKLPNADVDGGLLIYWRRICGANWSICRHVSDNKDFGRRRMDSRSR